MNRFETTATVEERGQIRLAGIPFEPGTEVDVTISPKTRSTASGVRTDDDDAAWAVARQRMRELLGAAKGFRNTPRIPREELYDRGRVS